MSADPSKIIVSGKLEAGFEAILTPAALSFLELLHTRFNPRRLELLSQRIERQKEIDGGKAPDFLPATASIRKDPSWQVGPIPNDLQMRRVEITGPVERKMMINALNSAADVFMADCEDANSPTWTNIIEGQINLRDAVQHDIEYRNPGNGKQYRLNEKVATLLVRPRGWHLNEKHLHLQGVALSASLVDFGLYLFHNAGKLIEKGSGPYFYIPKLENHLEARLWNDVFNLAQDSLGIPRGTIKVTVLIENILAAFEMEEILYELRDHIAGLNAGRWDYIFSVIKKFRNQPGFLLPDRGQITMRVPFMRAYSELLVKICHKRGAHAIGGMAAFIPNRRDPEVTANALSKVKEDKKREAEDGFDGTWIAHPDLDSVARREFDAVIGERPHQKEVLRDDVTASAADLLNFHIEGGKITEEGLRHNINVAILYIESWLRGVGAAGLYNLMEDAATAEISRAQVWQWIQHRRGVLPDGRKIDVAMCRAIIPEELAKVRKMSGHEVYESGKFQLAAQIFESLIDSSDFPDFLTLVAYTHL